MTTALSTTLLAGLLAAAACSDSAAPRVTVTTAAPDRLVPADDALDDLVITVTYDDGDGDLGGGVAQIHDCRAAGLETDLQLPAIAPPQVVDDGHPITGTLELHVSDVGAVTASALPAACEDLGVTAVAAGAAVFCVIPVDAAGHVGEGDCTHEIAVDAAP